MHCAENHMCGTHTDCEEYFPGNCHALHQEQGKAHKPALPHKTYFTDDLPPIIKRAWDKVTTDAMLRQCLHPYHTQGNEACNNSFTNCEMPKTRCQYAGTPIFNFRAAMFVLRQTTGYLGLLFALEQAGVHITQDQLSMANVLERRTDTVRKWKKSKHGKVRR